METSVNLAAVYIYETHVNASIYNLFEKFGFEIKDALFTKLILTSLLKWQLGQHPLCPDTDWKQK